MQNQLINSGAKDEIKKLFNFTADLNNNYLPKILNQMDLDDIHWFKKEELFSIKKDNGDFDVEYSLKISVDTVTFEYAFRGGSALAEAKSLYPILISLSILLLISSYLKMDDWSLEK